MVYFHKNLTQKQWNNFSKSKQILNIASELLRSKNWLDKKDNKHLQNSLERALELVDLTINDRKKWRKGSLRELLRFREALSEFYIKKKKVLAEIKLLIKNFLYFHKDSAVIEI